MFLAAQGSASAAPQTVARFVPSQGESPSAFYPYFSFSGPALAGDSVVWARNLPGGGWVVERGTAAGRVTRIARSARPPSDAHILNVVGATPARVAWADHAYNVISGHDMNYQTVRSTLYAAGTRAGSATPVTGCGAPGLPPCRCPMNCPESQIFADLGGDLLAYVEGPNYTQRTIVLDDLSARGDPLRIDPGAPIGTQVRIAGDYVAYIERTFDPGSYLVVYDWRNRRELYRVAEGRIFDLQADGKLAAIGFDERLRWFSPAEPNGRVIVDRVDRRSLSNVRIAGDRIAFTDTNTYAAGDSRIAVADLDGEARVIAGGGAAPVTGALGILDFDGRRAAWTSMACGIVSVVVEPDALGDAVRSPPSLRCTPPQIEDLRVAPGGRLVARVLCAQGCRGKFLVTAERSTLAEPTLVSARAELRASSRTQRLVLSPSRDVRRRLSKLSGSLRAQILFSGRDGDGSQTAATRVVKLKRP
jgi:hypothetical protein